MRVNGSEVVLNHGPPTIFVSITVPDFQQFPLPAPNFLLILEGRAEDQRERA